MANLATILKIKYPNARWIFRGDPNRYDKLVWQSDDPKPDEATIRSFSDEVDLIMSERSSAIRCEKDLRKDPGVLFDMVDLTAALHEAVIAALPQTVQDNIPQVLKDQLVQVRQKLNQIKASQ